MERTCLGFEGSYFFLITCLKVRPTQSYYGMQSSPDFHTWSISSSTLWHINCIMSLVRLLTALHFKGPGKIVLWDGYIFELSVGHLCYKRGTTVAKLCALLLPVHIAEFKWCLQTVLQAARHWRATVKYQCETLNELKDWDTHQVPRSSQSCPV